MTDREALRVAALERYRIVGSPPEPEYDRITKLAANLLKTSCAFITVIGKDDVWFKSRIGCDVDSLPRQGIVCADVMMQHEVCVIQDTAGHPCFSALPPGSPLAAIRFYAGAPLITPDGFNVGTLCVADVVPRHDICREHTHFLIDLAAQVTTLLELRRERIQQQRQSHALRLANEVLTVLAETRSFRDAVDAAVDHLIHAAGAETCNVWESLPGGDLIDLAAVRGLTEAEQASYSEVMQAGPVPRARLMIAPLFDEDGKTITRLLTPDMAKFPLMALGLARGIDSLAAHTMTIGERRFVVVLTFAQGSLQLEEKAQMLEHLSRAIRPVLARKLMDEELVLLSAALSATQDCVMITGMRPALSARPVIVFVNEAFTRTIGHTPAEAFGQRPNLLLFPDQPIEDMVAITTANLAGRAWHGELPCRRRDGTQFWAEMDVTMLPGINGWPTNFVAVLRDITARREAAEALSASAREAREAAAKLAATTDELLDAMRVARLGVWRALPGCKEMEWSEEMYRLFGVDPRTFVPNDTNVAALIVPEDHFEMQNRLRRVLSTGKPEVFEFRIKTPDGAMRHGWSEGHLQIGEDGRRASLFGYCQDVTERRQAEAMLLRTEKMNSIGQLTGGIAHDFNNLLTVISLNLEIAEEQLGPAHPAMEAIEPALLAARSGAQLTASLLSFARRSKLRPQSTDVASLIDGTARMAVRTLGERYFLAVAPPSKLAFAMIDPAQFESALLNLLVNSRDAMPGGGTIRIETSHITQMPDRPPPVDDLLPGDYVVVTVADSGVGIPAELRERVFEPFFSTKGPGVGTGLGLAMVASFARRSGGSVALESIPGQGTAVRMFLPVG